MLLKLDDVTEERNTPNKAIYHQEMESINMAYNASELKRILWD